VGKKISMDATAKELGISTRGVRRAISSGQLRAYKIGKLIRIDTDDIGAVLRMSTIIPSEWAKDTPPQFVRAHANRHARNAALEAGHPTCKAAVPSNDSPAAAPRRFAAAQRRNRTRGGTA
jgi:excisionase family DNA binding protein